MLVSRGWTSALGMGCVRPGRAFSIPFDDYAIGNDVLLWLNQWIPATARPGRCCDPGGRILRTRFWAGSLPHSESEGWTQIHFTSKARESLLDWSTGGSKTDVVKALKALGTGVKRGAICAGSLVVNILLHRIVKIIAARIQWYSILTRTAELPGAKQKSPWKSRALEGQRRIR